MTVLPNNLEDLQDQGRQLEQDTERNSVATGYQADRILGQLDAIQEKQTGVKPLTVDEILQQFAAARKEPAAKLNTVPAPITEKPVETKEFDPEAKADIGECLAIVSDQLESFYPDGIPEVYQEKLKDLANGKLQISSEELVKRLSLGGRSALQVAITNGVTFKDGILLKDEATAKTAVHEIFHFLCEGDQEDKQFSTIANEALTELWTYFAIKGVDLHDPVSVYRAIDYQEMRKFSGTVAGSYAAGFSNLMEHILEIRKLKNDKFVEALPDLFEGYLSRDPTKIDSSLGTTRRILTLWDLESPNVMDISPLKANMSVLLDSLSRQYPGLKILSEFKDDLEENAVYKYPEILLGNSDLTAAREGLSIITTIPEAKLWHKPAPERTITVSLGLTPALEIGGHRTSQLLPDISSKEAYMLWEAVKYARAATEQPVTNADLFNNALMLDYFSRLPADKQSKVANSVCTLFNIPAPEDLPDQIIRYKAQRGKK